MFSWWRISFQKWDLEEIRDIFVIHHYSVIHFLIQSDRCLLSLSISIQVRPYCITIFLLLLYLSSYHKNGIFILYSGKRIPSYVNAQAALWMRSFFSFFGTLGKRNSYWRKHCPACEHPRECSFFDRFTRIRFVATFMGSTETFWRSSKRVETFQRIVIFLWFVFSFSLLLVGRLCRSRLCELWDIPTPVKSKIMVRSHFSLLD